MTTATQIISQALGILRIRAPGDAVGNEAGDMLERLNMMLDGWRLESLFATAGIRVTATLGAVATATIGPSADFDIDPRPFRIEDGSFYTVGGLDYPIEVVDLVTFNNIALKDLAVLGPDFVYYEAGDPTGTVYFYPQGAAEVTLICLGTLESFADMTTGYDLGPGVKRALAYSLAEDMAGDFETKLSEDQKVIAKHARRSLKRSHHVTPQLRTPPIEGTLARFLRG
jgi:hypothetical protein